jgi:predicted Zn finger-like uncharacterized protein
MKVSCPSCKFTGNINDDHVPEQGKKVSCPKCKTRFLVQRPVVSVITDEPEEKKPPKVESASYDWVISDNAPKPVIKVARAQCQNCGGEVKIPENRKIVLCPHCGSNIIKQAIPDEKDFGLMETIKRDASRMGRQMYRNLKIYLRGRQGRKTVGVVLFIAVLLLFSYSVKINNTSSDTENLLDKKIRIFINVPKSGEEASYEAENGSILKDLIVIDVSSQSQLQKDEPRIYQIIFKDGSKSEYFRYYRYNENLIYIMLPDSEGGSYERGYPDSEVNEIRRIRTVPNDVKVYGID